MLCFNIYHSVIIELICTIICVIYSLWGLHSNNNNNNNNTTQEAYPVQKGLFIDSYPTVIV